MPTPPYLYDIVTWVILGFIDRGREQIDVMYRAGQVVLEWDGLDTLYAVSADGVRRESITQARAISVWLAEGRIRAR